MEGIETYTYRQQQFRLRQFEIPTDRINKRLQVFGEKIQILESAEYAEINKNTQGKKYFGMSAFGDPFARKKIYCRCDQ